MSLGVAERGDPWKGAQGSPVAADCLRGLERIRDRMNTQANLAAIRDRIAGQPVGQFRAVAIAGTAGVGVAALIYRVLRNTDEE